MAAHHARRERSPRLAHRHGQDARGVPRRAGRPREAPPERGRRAPALGSLRLAAEGARQRRPPEPRGPQAGNPAPPRGTARGRSPHRDRRPDRRHERGRPGGPAPAPSRHPHHHARVPVPDAHRRGPAHLRIGFDADPGRGPLHCRNQARRAPRADARAARVGHRGRWGPVPGPCRAVGHGRSPRARGGARGRGGTEGHPARRLRAEGTRPEGPLPGTRVRQGGRLGMGPRHRRHRRRGGLTQDDARLLQQPPPGRACGRTARGEAGHQGARAPRFCRPRPP